MDCIWWLPNWLPHVPSGQLRWFISSPISIYVNKSGSLRSLQSTLLFYLEGRLGRVGFTGQITSYHPTINWEVCWPAHQFHLSRTHDHDSNDEELSKDIVMGYQGCYVHTALSLCTHTGVLMALLLFQGCAYHLNWVSFALTKQGVLFLTPSSAHQFFMAYCTHQLNMGNLSLDTRSGHC